MVQSLRRGDKRKGKQLGFQEYLEQTREKKIMRLTEQHIEQEVTGKAKPDVQQLLSTASLFDQESESRQQHLSGKIT